MTSEAPERIWLQWVEPHCDDNTWCVDKINDDDAEYIRADLHQHALDAAREEGRRAGLEEAAKEACYACGAQDEVYALIDTPADPVAEAARVILSSRRRGIAPLVLNAFESERMKWVESQAMREGHVPPETITLAMFEAALRALAQKEGE